ncbi:uncharacterized protein FFFS_15790 [Fusarium fujikuroi]|nr:uncharacterized protein FFFS_15790 [Fusarium fujikuroi]
MGKRIGVATAQPRGANEGESELADNVGQLQVLEDESGNNASLMQTMLQAMLRVTSAHLVDEQRKMFERLWKALMGSQQTATQMMGEQLEVARQLQQEVWAAKVQAVEESKKVDELRRLHQQSTRQLRVIREQSAKEQEQLREEMRQVKEDTRQAKEAILLAKREVQQVREEMQQAKEEARQMKEQLNTMADSISSDAQTSPQPSYADVARTPPTNQPSNVRTLSSMRTTLSSFTDTFAEDKDKAQVGEIRQAIEAKVRARDGQQGWRCAAVVRDVRNADRIKVVCRDETEVQLVKEVAEKAVVKGARVLRDQLYPVTVDGANRTAVLDSSGNVLSGAIEAPGKENEVTIAKMHWLSNKENGKMYGSMVIYLTKAGDARRLLEERYFHLAGESASTNVFERRQGPTQCFNCWETGHKAFACNKAQRCGKCAETGHRHHDCQTVEPKCVLRGGPHESLSRNCRLNVRKREVVQLSMMNDGNLPDYAVLAVAEPYELNIDGALVTPPSNHKNWTRFVPSQRHDMQWPIRSVLWIRSDLKAEQVAIPSADLTGAILRWPDREVLVVSVYVAGQDECALHTAMRQLHTTIASFRSGTGKRADMVLAGDFNRHDQLWGGDEVTGRRQGEAGPIIDLMDEHGLISLSPRGTKTWEGPDSESTIDLMLASTELADEMVHCGIHPTEHGSDHRAIRTEFDLATPERTVDTRLLFKNAPWNAIRERVRDKLAPLPWEGGVQTQRDRLMGVVLNAIDEVVPRAKPSPYAKRWWTTDLTKLRRTHTFWRNLARARRRAGQRTDSLEDRAKEAAKEYHDAIRRQKRAHWEDFLADWTNIWQGAKYLKPRDESTGGDKVPALKRADGTTTQDKAEQAQEMLSAFFPPLPTDIEDESPRRRRREVAMPDLTMEEVEEKVMEAKPWKAPGQDGLPAMVWKQLWPAVKERVMHLFRTWLSEGRLPDQWRAAKIIPLKKPGKKDYKIARTRRPISLLSTLVKILEAVVADRISEKAEVGRAGLADLPGAGLQSLAQPQRVVSLVSFDVKGAYNGVFKDRLLQRLEARGIPERLVKWINAFCSNRRATITAGLPQGSPLSPVLFLFFNAGLVQSKIDSNGGSIAFVDDYSAWVTGAKAEENREGIQAIIDSALAWARRCGATFECDKTTIVHFTRVLDRTSRLPFTIMGEEVTPKQEVKLLGVIMDAKLRFKKHMAEATARGLSAAMCLRRLKTLPKTHPLATLKVSVSRRYMSPLKRLTLAHDGSGIERMETIEAYAAPPWHGHVSAICEADHEAAVAAARETNDIIIATSASDRRGLVGMGGVVAHKSSGQTDKIVARYSVTLGSRDEQNPFTAELEAIAMLLRCLPDGLQRRELADLSSSQSALKTIARPRQQSGQVTIRQIYEHVERLRKGNNSVKMIWVPARHDDLTTSREAKKQAQRATKTECTSQTMPYQARSTRIRLMAARLSQ